MTLLFTLALAAAALGQSAWVLAYVTSPWQETPIGWVWLFKGAVLAVLLNMVVIDRVVVDMPVWVWMTMMWLFAAAIWTWLIATLKAKRADYFT